MKKEVLPARGYKLEIVAIVAAHVALIACAAAPEASDPIELTPIGDEMWSDQVAEAAAVWNKAIGCYPAFEVARNAGLPVTLYPEASWPGASNERGYYDGAEIAVRMTTREVERSTLVHELGHVIGLQHSEDKTSVMYPIVSVTYRPSDTDIENAMSALDCP